MSRKGTYFDNAVIESFFGTLKAEYFRLERPCSKLMLSGNTTRLDAGAVRYCPKPPYG